MWFCRAISLPLALATGLALAGSAHAQPGLEPEDAPAAQRLILPLLATAETSDYGRLSSVVEIANVSDAEARYIATLRGNLGSLPLQLGIETVSGLPWPASELQDTLAAGTGKRAVFVARGSLLFRWAEFLAEPAGALSVSAVLRAERADGTASRAAIPTVPTYRRAWLHADNAEGSVTALVLVEPNAGPANGPQTFVLRYRDFSRDRACEASVDLEAHQQLVLATEAYLPCSAGGRGLIEISGPAEFAGIGLLSSETDGILARQLAGQAPEPYVALPQWAVAPGQVGFGSPLAGGCVTLAGTQVEGTTYTVHSSKWQRRAEAGDAWTDVPGTARSGQLCPYDPTESGEFRAVAEITVGDERGLFASSDVLTVEDGPPPLPGIEEFTNGVGMEFVKMPAGEFLMGATGAWGLVSELPVTRVRISEAFWMGKYEVTQGQWQAVTGSNASTFGNCGADCPVESVSWNDVQGFVERLNEMEGGAHYRLPTEAEWEYAARAGTQTDTYAGDLIVHGTNNAPLLDRIAWYGGNSGVDYEGGQDCSEWIGKQHASSSCGPHPVGMKATNRFALHDLLGNVQEWVQDWWGEYPGGSVTDPAGPESGSFRTFRGGSWFHGPTTIRSASRWRVEPDRRFSDLGFRLVRVDSADPAADEYVPLDGWTVSDGSMQFFSLSAEPVSFSAEQCVIFGNTTFNGMTYTVHGSKWQRRSDASAAWTDIPGTAYTGTVCSYSPTEPGQYRSAAEISIDGERGKYSTKNVLTVDSDDSGSQTVTVALGTSGDTVAINEAEGGSYRVGDAQFASGDTVTASNGNVYVLTLEDGTWTATYVLVEIVVALGSSGETATIVRAEDGSFRIGDAVVASGDIVTASNGNEYRLTLRMDGTWTATLIVGAQPSFGTAAVSNQTYTAGTAVTPLTLPAASGGDGTLSYSLSPSVPGLTFSASTRRLTGTPMTPGTYNMTYAVTDADGDTASLNFVVTVNSASPPTETTTEYMPAPFWRVRVGGITLGQFSAGGCIVLGTDVIASSKWQRRDSPDSPWVDVPGTEETGRVCPYSPTEPGQYRQVGVINVDGEVGNWASSNFLSVGP